MSDGEDNNGDEIDLPIQPEEIPQDIPSHPPTRLARPAINTTRNDYKVRIIADPPASITGVLPKPLGKSRAERWDQPTLRGASERVMESDIHDSEMRRLYVKGKALQPHERSPDHTAAMFHINEYAKSLPSLSKDLVTRHDDPDWMTEAIQSFNANPSGIPRNC
ncbi:hypothetical protein M422DRAFT_265100 [Sphaerobolus stellatus SS14]|uniref:Uncharacterized protein n=1 Tax=Sphaerobolus stellatus (strain SS14) TaxID=990650 RepID=A0A0C9UUX2_SPHS4|nr:hypothetical protein M422DRAFT_265100 [Sphaerobolus stellatus SS14]